LEVRIGILILKSETHSQAFTPLDSESQDLSWNLATSSYILMYLNLKTLPLPVDFMGCIVLTLNLATKC